ncbi:hypothetical protein [Sphingobium lignivorans]|uniref:Lipoprotein n=1 Tax=Sphingobium lignivorans TaxID=2735886 RepID=A0ABR6NMZ3_9SPHN|nr:hypothetical protein [Sphingobium lignivorans]MBB5987564.1 hypothetical protein [Sphingobium lignivorans]
MRLLLIGIATLSLAACGGTPENSVENAAIPAAENAENAVNYVAEIGNLSDTQQQAVFFRAIRDAGIACRDVTSVEQIEPQNGVQTWRAQCDQGGQHLIQVLPDGSAQVVSRTEP